VVARIGLSSAFSPPQRGGAIMRVNEPHRRHRAGIVFEGALYVPLTTVAGETDTSWLNTTILDS
jgi:hypothetical protein